jgi:hypothetical protein
MRGRRWWAVEAAALRTKLDAAKSLATAAFSTRRFTWLWLLTWPPSPDSLAFAAVATSPAFF